MKVLIVGAGIAGLSLAACLKQRGIQPLVVEQSPKWKNIGFILTLWPFGVKRLQEMGITGYVRPRAASPSGLSILDEGGRVLARLNLKSLALRYGRTIEIERDTLHRALRKINRSTTVRMGTTVTRLKQGKSGVAVMLSDGTREVFDLVVGADGIDSKIRSRILPSEREEYEGLTFWMFWVPKPFKLNEVRYYAGRRKYVALFPTIGSHCCAMFVIPAREHSYTKQADMQAFIREKFAGMSGDVANLLDCLPRQPHAFFHHDDNEVHARQWYKGRVVLVGDAAHAVSSVTGMGASLAMEDAFVLAEELSQQVSVEEALERYTARRQPRVAFVSMISMHLHRLALLPKPLYGIRNGILKQLGSLYLWWIINRIHRTKI